MGLVGLVTRTESPLRRGVEVLHVDARTRLLVVEKWRRGDVDELDVRHREQHLRAFHIRKTEPRGAGERRFATGACNAPQRRPRHLRELLRSEHGEAAKPKDADADRGR